MDTTPPTRTEAYETIAEAMFHEVAIKAELDDIRAQLVGRPSDDPLHEVYATGLQALVAVWHCQGEVAGYLDRLG